MQLIIIMMGRYSTISIPEEVKRILERAKGDRSWGEYLLQLYMERTQERRRRAFEEMRELLSERELEKMEESMRRFREEFRLRGED